MIRYAITNGRRDLESIERLLARAGADLLQIREKELSVGDLFRFTRAVMRFPNPGGTRILVNGRADVALAAEAAGVHLPGGSIAPGWIRRLRAEWAISVACHTLEEVMRAQDEGADYAIFSPIFEVPGKGPAQGLDRLREVCATARVPVLALGGVNARNLDDCLKAGAAGVAGIRLFLS